MNKYVDKKSQTGIRKSTVCSSRILRETEEKTKPTHNMTRFTWPRVGLLWDLAQISDSISQTGRANKSLAKK